jgi:hypothetical protein
MDDEKKNHGLFGLLPKIASLSSLQTRQRSKRKKEQSVLEFTPKKKLRLRSMDLMLREKGNL